MNFNSYLFFFFFFIVFFLHWTLPKKFQNKVLLISSYVFYSFWDWRFLSLIWISTITDFFFAKKIIRSPDKKKAYLTVSITINLVILGIFKYFGFFVEQFSNLLMVFGNNGDLNTVSFILPVGISFYTFQTMSYSIDVYRGITKPINNIFDFALYVSFFPQLVAGPIERSYKLIPQLRKIRNFCEVNVMEGFYLILYGLFMKVVMADNMAVIANGIFSQSNESLIGADIIIGAYAFAFQIYGDFSGYSLIAIGISKFFGINLTRNFKVPYISSNPSEFWKRWHISLSSWLKDYLYIPMGGSRRGLIITYKNLLITMFLGGLWHGANWTFILWGLYHGALLITYKELAKYFKIDNQYSFKEIKHVLHIIIFFQLTCLGWIFFRAESINDVCQLFTQLIFNFSFSDDTFGMLGLILFFVFPIFLYEVWDEKKKFNSFKDRSSSSLLIFSNYCFLMIVLFKAPSFQDFIYFQF